MSKKLSLSDCHKRAKAKGGKCLSAKYTNAITKIKWLCSENHTWEATYNNIQQGKWCPRCIGVAKNTIDDCHVLAKNKNGHCLSSEYINRFIKMEWRCAHNHIWTASFSSIKNKVWCPYCAKNARLNIGDCRDYANCKNGKCLSDEYSNAKTLMTWECDLGHLWRASFGNIKYGTWCPKCSSGKSQKLLFDILQNIYSGEQIVYNYKGFTWLKNIKRMEIDIWIPHLKLAIEYDGRHHFMPVKFGGCSDNNAKESFGKQKIRDSIKDDLINENKDTINYFIRFKYDEPITSKYVLDKLRSYDVRV